MSAYINTGPVEAAGNADFFIPHSLTLIESRDTICVADREHGRSANVKVELYNYVIHKHILLFTKSHTNIIILFKKSVVRDI